MTTRTIATEVQIKFYCGPVDLHWVVYVDDECVGEARKMYGASGRGNDGYRWDLIRHSYDDPAVYGYEDDLAVAIGRVLIGESP